jgi:predicted NUDIX family NTP pyrophosphohydrolase
LLAPGSLLAMPSAKAPGFAPVRVYKAGPTTSSVASGDVNGDGRIDLVAAVTRLSRVSVLLNKGGGTFRAGLQAPACCEPGSVAVGDLNGDGKADVVATGSSGVRVLISKGAGAFVKPTREYATPYLAYSAVIGDLNGDGKRDIATSNINADSVSVLLNKGGGTFGAHTDFKVGKFPISIARRDVNGDRKPDLVTANNNSSSVSVLLNRGDGTFLPKRDLQVPAYPSAIAVGDVNGDRRPELVVAGHGSGVVSVLPSKGGGRFGARRDYKVGAAPRGVQIGDLNRDGRPDVATAVSVRRGARKLYEAAVLVNLGGGRFGGKANYGLKSTSQPLWLVLDHLNRDRRLDLATANGSANTVSVLLNTTR